MITYWNFHGYFLYLGGGGYDNSFVQAYVFLETFSPFSNVVHGLTVVQLVFTVVQRLV